MRRFLAILACAMCALSVPAAAQRNERPVVTSSTSAASGLEAQYQVALIRDRRLADERETELIAQYETQLRTARARFDQGIAGAQAELTQARAQFTEYVAQVAQRDASVRAEIEAYRAEARGLAQRASPELLDAYQRFADGDRVGAWPAISELTQAQVRATLRVANRRAAESVRGAARARTTMFQNREATAQDALALWDQAAALDPSDFSTHFQRTMLLSSLGRFDEAERAYEAAQRFAPSGATGQVMMTATRTAIALGRAEERLVARAREREQESRRIAGERPGDREAQRTLARALITVTIFTVERDSEGSRSKAEEALTIARRLVAESPDDPEAPRDVLQAMAAVAMTGGSVSWSDTAAYVDDMIARGRLTDADRQHLTERRAHEESAASPRSPR